MRGIVETRFRLLIGFAMRRPVRILDFSNAAGTGDWSADILVRQCVMVNRKAHWRTRMSNAARI